MAENPVVSTTDQSVFQGLFEDVLKPEPALVAKLKAIGYDMARQEPTYPTRVWRDALETTRQHLWPEMKAADAQRKLGRATVAGYLSTIAGSVIAASLPHIGAEGLVKRWPRFYGSARHGVEVIPTFEAPKRARIRFTDEAPLPEFVAGLMDECVHRIGQPVTITVDKEDAQSFELLLVW
jgi:uncharacterized protein (TIGR02265 family)